MALGFGLLIAAMILSIVTASNYKKANPTVVKDYQAMIKERRAAKKMKN